MNDVPIYRKVLDNNLVRRAVAIERINTAIIDENTKLRSEVAHLQEQIFQLNEESTHDFTDNDFMEHFGSSMNMTEATPIGNKNTSFTNKCCCIL